MMAFRKVRQDEEDMVQSERTVTQKAQGKLGLFVRNNIIAITGFVIMLLMIAVGSNMSSDADAQVENIRHRYAEVINKTATMNSSLQETVTVVDAPDHGFDSKRQQEDYKYFTKWIQPAFEWEGLDEYNEHRAQYVSDLGPGHSFVRPDGLMPPLTSQPLKQDAYGNAYSPDERMQCHIDESGPITQYVASIDEETGIYSYVAIVFVTGKDNLEVVRLNSVPIIMTYDMRPDDGSGSFRIFNFTAGNGVNMKQY